MPPVKELPLKKLLGRYLLKYGLAIVVFGWVFATIERYFVSKKLSIDLFTGSFMDMLIGKSWDHMWYMYALFGTMLVVPILRLITKHCQKSYIYYFVVVFGLFLTIIPIGEHYLQFKLGVALPFNSVYCFYMLLGYWIDHKDILISKKISAGIMAVLFPVIIVLTVLQQIYQFDTEVLFAYFSPIIDVLSVGIFSFFRNTEHLLSAKETPAFVKFLGKYSFGVYIIHMFWINIAYKLLKIDPFQINAIAGFFILWIWQRSWRKGLQAPMQMQDCRQKRFCCVQIIRIGNSSKRKSYGRREYIADDCWRPFQKSGQNILFRDRAA